MKQEEKIKKKIIPWNKRELNVDEILRLYFKEKMSCPDIAKIMNCSVRLINNKVEERGFKLRTISEARKLKHWGLFGVDNPMYGKKSWNRREINSDKIINLYLKEKKSCVNIAKIMDCSTTPIYRILRENNVKMRIDAGYFKKGTIPWNKDKNHPKYKEYIELVRKIGKGNKGRKSVRQGLTMEEEYGIKRAKEINNKNRINHLGKKASERTKLLMSNQRKGKKKTKEWKENIGLAHLGIKRPFEDRKKMSAGKQGIPLERWDKFVSREPYDQRWTNKLREIIRKRDNFICQECGKTQKELKRKLQVHHIDYNKKRSIPQNLITLCELCHSRTQSNRKHWERYFKNIMALREIFNPENLLIFNENKQLIGVTRI